MHDKYCCDYAGVLHSTCVAGLRSSNTSSKDVQKLRVATNLLDELISFQQGEMLTPFGTQNKHGQHACMLAGSHDHGLHAD